MTAKHPALRPRIWMDRERLLRLMVFFAQLTQTEAANHVPRALDCCYRSPRAPRSSLLIGRRGEDCPSDVEPRRPLEVGAAAAQRLPSAQVAVVGWPRMIPRRLIPIHCAATASANTVATHSRRTRRLTSVLSGLTRSHRPLPASVFMTKTALVALFLLAFLAARAASTAYFRSASWAY